MWRLETRRRKYHLNTPCFEALRFIMFADGRDNTRDTICNGSEQAIFEVKIGGRIAKILRPANICGKASRANKSFRRYATCIEAIATQGFLFDQGHSRSELR